MAVTPIGWILLIVGPLLLIARTRWLYMATVFFLPFTATGVINIGSGYNSSAVQVSMYLGSLLILRHLAGFLVKGKLPFPIAERASLVWLGLFIAATALSLMMPIWIDGHIMIPSGNLADLTTSPLYLSSHNVTAVLYMVYGFLFTYLIAVVNRKKETFRLTLKTFMAGSIFAALWAILELTCKISGIPYPAAIFNTGAALSTMGYKEHLTESVYRLSSVGVEPSIFAQTLLVAVSLYLPFVFGSARLFGRVLDRYLFSLLFAVLCLTTSSTAYVGILVALLIVLVLFTIKGVLGIKHFVQTMAGLVLAVVLYAFIPVVRSVIDEAVFSKSVSYSSLERLTTIYDSWGMFLRYPVLGIGWGSITSHDLFVAILGNAGIVGLVPFVAAMYAIFRGLYSSIKSRSKSLRVEGLMQMDFAMYVALGVTLFTSALSGFLNTFSFFWFTCGLAIAVLGTNGISGKEHFATPFRRRVLA
jgi:O-antigen ligase